MVPIKGGRAWPVGGCGRPTSSSERASALGLPLLYPAHAPLKKREPRRRLPSRVGALPRQDGRDRAATATGVCELPPLPLVRRSQFVVVSGQQV